jgi:hypothetical protein
MCTGSPVITCVHGPGVHGAVPVGTNGTWVVSGGDEVVGMELLLQPSKWWAWIGVGTRVQVSTVSLATLRAKGRSQHGCLGCLEGLDEWWLLDEGVFLQQATCSHLICTRHSENN